VEHLPGTQLTLLVGVGVFQSYYEFGPLKDYDSSTISWIPSLEIFFLFVLGPFVGFLFDKYGPTPLILVGTFLHVFGLMMASLATEYYQFLLAQGVCSAIGLSFLYSPGRFLPGPMTSWSIPLLTTHPQQRLRLSQPGSRKREASRWASW
jgi:MFS family permease